MLEDTATPRRISGFLITLALTLLLGPLGADASPPAKVPRTGVLGTGSLAATSLVAPF